MKKFFKILPLLIVFFILVGLVKYSKASKVNIAYLYGNYNYISLVERTEGGLNFVSPSSFDLDNTRKSKIKFY